MTGVWLVLLAAVTLVTCEGGYVLFCPCMGRLGNQITEFLGTLAWAKEWNRTVVLPHWVTWRGISDVHLVPFTEWFNPDALTHYHRWITMEDFMDTVATSGLWDPDSRVYHCPAMSACDPTAWSPLKDYWEFFGIEFSRSRVVSMEHPPPRPLMTPVLALGVQPGGYPARPEHRVLQKYLAWSDNVVAEAAQLGPTGPYIGVHLRLGKDWVRACGMAVGKPSFMESDQCNLDAVTTEVCRPSMDDMASHVNRVASTTGVWVIFVASDSSSLVFRNFLTALDPRADVRVSTAIDSPQLDLAVLDNATHFVGNCVSSYSAFVKRARDVRRVPSSFFGVS